jgi:hypothetical protein
MLAIIFLYSSFLFYGFRIRFVKMHREDLRDSMHDMLYKNMSRRERRIILRNVTKK